MAITLTKIAFCEYLLEMNTTEEGCSVNLQFAINNVNKKYNKNSEFPLVIDIIYK